MSTAAAASGKASTGAGRPARWLARRTLRGRLIAGLLALLAMACAAVGLVTYVALHDSLINQLDALARAAVSHGRAVPAEAGAAGDVALVHGGELVAVARADAGWLRPSVVLGTP